MTREWMESLKGKLPTAFGDMEFVLTSGSHVYLSAGSSSDMLPGLTVNRILYYVSAHLYRTTNGTWEQKTRGELHMSRKSYSGEDASRAAEEKAYAGIRDAWEKFIFGQETPLIEAELRDLNNEIHRADEAIEEAEAALKELDRSRDYLISKERMVKDARAEFIKKGGYPQAKDWSPSGQLPREPEESS